MDTFLFDELGLGQSPADPDNSGVAIKEEESDFDQDNGQALQDVDWAFQEEEDDKLIQGLTGGHGESGAGTGMGVPKEFATFLNKEIDQTGKADDAIDFEDISDSDLSDLGSDAGVDAGISQVPGLTEDEGTSHNTDNMESLEDLFGSDEHDILPSSPIAVETSASRLSAGLTMPTGLIVSGGLTMPSTSTVSVPLPAPKVEPKVLEDGEVSDDVWNNMSFEERQQLNFPTYTPSIDKWINQVSKEDLSGQKAPENKDELLAQKFPHFKKYKTLYLNKLFPAWPAEYMYKQPPHKDRDPPEFIPTKLDLELEADSAKLFKLPVTTSAGSTNGDDDWGLEATEDDSDNSESGESLVGGYTMDEFTAICVEWDPSALSSTLTTPAKVHDEEMDDWDKEFKELEQAQELVKFKPSLPEIPMFDTFPSDDYLRATRFYGKRVRLDESDPYLLLAVDDDSRRPPKRLRHEEKTVRMANGQQRRDVLHHFNMSNDSEYDALKVNHKSKVRATLSNLAVEHSLPALKLTFPFYRTKVQGKPWEHHRKRFDLEKIVKHAIGVRKPARIRRKETKGRSNQEIFKTTRDLSLNDNSTAVLFEYCEEFPIMMSNFGMGSRVINYYRRKDRNDEDKMPKLDLGEGHALLPEDRSPFAIFGTVDPGEMVPTLHNEMYRAPIFKHEPRPTDFLLGITTSSLEGPKFFLRKIDHVYTVGQTFPSLEVPGPHARRVTNTSKNRLKMIAYRMMKKKETQDVGLAEITPHVFEKQDPQNRQKMKEFLTYHREKKTWVLPKDQTLMDESAIRSMIKPEDACLIEAMQIGQQLLVNAGYDPKDKLDDDDGVEEPLVARMAPWELTKNFIDASAGKAMVALHGEGDPTGQGLGFSFIKTSMKGGYINAVQGPMATSTDAIERERKANGGHSYNVKKQQDMYNKGIEDIWKRQKITLSDPTTHEDTDVLDTTNEDDRFDSRQPDATPAPMDDGRSQFSRLSTASRSGKKKKLKITRKKLNEAGEIITETVILNDPVVIRNYLKQRREIEDKNRDVYSLQPTGDADENRERQKLVEKELSRLLKNQDRRQIREKQGKGKRKKGSANADANAGASPPAGADKSTAGTTRKCANCGQVGHIKTNKSKCPLLNGTITTANGGADHGGFGSFGATSVGPSAGTPSANE
ncbi:uncharacterized protein GGS22DRAFT_172212 [Annulohypoxylon maeteangense]|uniref:uncharacterized protein n=1 Tax=Annulohypoxylon maeteangense TaxID=1927788 RepID=UPI0020077769|nr:uncharacterized protein GGS22DRAFT_172212 [Annulohypoxylon maeteangense]KAI0881460.1 hypothetical protein GGS22DRAFT_172212 [Annulohypoxylon maeteangense]